MLSIFLIGSHLFDVSTNMNPDFDTATNGFYEIDLIKLYHTGYYGMYLAFFILLIAYIDLLVKNK